MNRIIIFFLISAMLIACKTQSSIEVFENGVSIEKISDSKKISLIKSAFDDKQEVVFKRRPDFEYLIIIDNKGNKTEWLYSSVGAITEKEPGSAIYKFKLLPNQILSK